MKLLISVFILLHFTNPSIAKYIKCKVSIPQNSSSSLNKEWIGPGGEYLRIKNDSAYFANPGGVKYMIRLDERILTLIPYQNEEDSFSIVQLNHDTLVLKAANKNAYNRVNTSEPIAFVNYSILTDPSFSFQKIFYSIFGGMHVGNFSRFQIKVDSTGSMLLYCNQVRDMPGKTKLMGTYKGQLSGDQLKRLNQLINNSVPERFSLDTRHALDAPSVTMKIYYKNKMKGGRGNNLPYLARDLDGYLSSLIYSVKLEKVADQFWQEQ